ncbi:aminotransferase class V-fold PLP-dependent enzyme [Candidatus Bathyarchaeota archaeon]|nr:aminotransferase class V-fold PLP-dependent enzyme [Candidatus Bathyarchaeota archaeon]
MNNIESIREDFPTLKDWTYLDNAFVGLMPKQVREGYMEWIDEWYNFRITKNTILNCWLEKSTILRNMISNLIGVQSSEIAFTMCTGSGLNIVINGIDWKKGDNVIFTEWEHNPLVTNTTRKNGVESRVLKASGNRFELSNLEKMIDDKTRLVQISQVCYTNGFRFNLKDVAQIVHEHGAKLLVDATQAVGAIQVDYKKDDVDYVSVAPYKYLMGPAGLAFLYVNNQSVNELTPDRVGWKNQLYEGDNPEESITEGKAEKFEYGTINFQGVYALIKSIEYLNKIGIENVENQIINVNKYLYEKLEYLGKKVWTPIENESPIISFIQENPENLAKKLQNMKIKVTGRRAHGGHMRVSVHFYNTIDDIDLLIKNL